MQFKRLRGQHFFNHELGVVKTDDQLLAAAELLQQRQLVCAEVSLLINVGHCTHQWTQDELGVVLWGKGEQVKNLCPQRALRDGLL